LAARAVATLSSKGRGRRGCRSAGTATVVRAAGPYKHCSIHPYFTILDEAAARPIMEEFVEKTKHESGCIWYGWDKVGDKLFCNEAYVDADAVAAHLENVGPCIEKILNGPAKLEGIAFHGPAAELEKLKETAANLSAGLLAVDSGVNFMTVENGPTTNPFTLCTIHPYFTIIDEAAAKPIMDEFVEKTKAEKGCVYYGWTKEGNQLFCREGYVDGDAVLAHLDNVGELIGKILDGPAKLDRIEFHGPAAELEKLKATADSLGATCYPCDSGFQRYEKAA